VAPQRLLYLRWPTWVEDNEGLGLCHRETDQHGTFEPSGDDRNAGENPSQGRDAGAPGEASER